MASILIVDDDRFVRLTLRDLLSDSGFELLEAIDGEEAVALIEQKKPELVLLDLLMPRLSGLEVIGRIPTLSPQTRVLVISALDSESLVESALEAGAAGFVAKPFHPIEIAAAINEALR
jgi:two-component system chemotaxis response regulator CheY